MEPDVIVDATEGECTEDECVCGTCFGAELACSPERLRELMKRVVFRRDGNDVVAVLEFPTPNGTAKIEGRSNLVVLDKARAVIKSVAPTIAGADDPDVVWNAARIRAARAVRDALCGKVLAGDEVGFLPFLLPLIGKVAAIAGPLIPKAVNLIKGAFGGGKKEQEKIVEIKKAADAGDAEAKKAQEVLKTVNELRKAEETAKREEEQRKKLEIELAAARAQSSRPITIVNVPSVGQAGIPVSDKPIVSRKWGMFTFSDRG